MSPYLRQVKTASGATAVQVVAKDHGVRRIVEHLGSAHDEAELAALMRLGRQRLLAGQQVLDLGPILNDDADEVGGQAPGDGGAVRRPQIISRRSGWLIEALRSAYRRLGLGEAVGGDRAFEQMVAARLIEPTSKADTPRVLSEIGWPAPAHRNTLYASLARAQERGYRESLSNALFEHVTNTSGLALCLYDVTTLYFEAEKEDDLRRVGYSKERRVDPQVIVGLLVDRRGFPLQVGCWEGNKAETTTIIPVVEAFQAAHGIEELVIVADAGMLSAANLTALDDARLRFIVGARTTRAPGDLEAHFHWAGDATLDEASLARARSLVGLKGYVTNIPSRLMGAGEVVSSYHELWHVEQSFRMSRPESPPRLPPPARCHRGAPDRGHGRPGRRPAPPGDHRDQHQTHYPCPQAPPGRHHQPQRPPPHRRRPPDPRSRRNPHRPEHPNRTLKTVQLRLDTVPAMYQRSRRPYEQAPRSLDTPTH